ncbi:MAG: hypothetical protein FJX76_09745 [Armatimonadetes bacterium]|nr:hypothetical protein [Armatimonadota bacterium]
MDDLSLQNEKLDPALRDMVAQQTSESIPVIVQTVDGLKEDDRRIVEMLGGKVKDDLYIINAFSADLTVPAIQGLVMSPRVTKIYFDAPVKAF